MNNLAFIKDATGIWGGLTHYSLVICFVGGAFIIFLYLWKRGKLNMDEGPKFEMMESDESLQQTKNGDRSKHE